MPVVPDAQAPEIPWRPGYRNLILAGQAQGLDCVAAGSVPVCMFTFMPQSSAIAGATFYLEGELPADGATLNKAFMGSES